MANKRRKTFITMTDGKMKGVYEVVNELDQPPSNDADGGNICPCCQAAMKAAFDVMQLGFWDDAYTTYFCCPSCGKASVFRYSLSRIEAVKEKRGKKAGKHNA